MRYSFFKKFLYTVSIVAIVCCATLSPVFAAPGVPTIVSYQGRLTNSTGKLLGGSGTNYYFRFSFWTTPTIGGGSKLWPAGQPGTITKNVVDGVFDVAIGDTVNGYPDALIYNFEESDTTYLQIEVSSDGSSFETLGPRQRITSSGYAINAQTVGGKTPGTAAGNILTLGANGEIVLASTGVSTLGDIAAGTISTGTWNGTAIEDQYITKTGNWTGTFDGNEGSYYLDANNLSNFAARVGTTIGTLSTDDIAQGATNLYFSNTLARAALSAGTGIGYDNITGIITNSGVLSFNTRSGAVTLASGDVTTALGFTPIGASGTTAQYIRGNGTLATFPTTVASFTNDAGYISANETITLSGDITGSGTTAITTIIGAGKVTNSMLTGSITSSKLVGTDITTLGTITSGTWQGTAIADAYISSAAIWNAKENALTFSTGLTRSTNTITIDTTQNISNLSNLSTNGLVKTSAGDGTVSIATAGTDYQIPITLTTTGTSGAASFIAGTLNIPQYTSTTYTGTSNRISISGSAIDIDAAYVGQNSITTLGTITSGTWQGTAIADAYISSAAIWNAKENALTFSTGLTRSTNTITIDNSVVTLTGSQALSNKTGNISQWTNDSGYATGGGSASGTNTEDITLGVIGSSPNTSGASLVGQILTLQPADATRGGVLTAVAQDILGEKKFLNRIVIEKTVDSSFIANSTTGRSVAVVSGALKSSFLFDNGGAFSIQTNTKANVNAGTPSGTSLFEISTTGDVSIGTTTAADQPRLDILFSQTAITTASKTVIRGRNAGSTFQTGGQAKTNYIAEFINTATRNSGANALTNVGLYASASGAQLNYAAIFAAGNVGIGDLTPDYALDVYGTICQDTNSDEVCDGAVTSDARLKTNIENIPSVLEKIRLLRGVYFDWDETNSHTQFLGRGTRQVGVIAQEVEAVFPSLIYYDAQGYRMVDYQKLSGPLIEAVKELDIQVQAIPVFEDVTFIQKIEVFLRGIAERGEAVLDTVRARKLCAEDVCVTRDQLQQMIDYMGAHGNQSAPSSNQTPPVTPPAPVEADEVVPEGDIEVPVVEPSIDIPPVVESEAPVEEAPALPETELLQ